MDNALSNIIFAPIMLLTALFDCLIAPFADFTFTDAVDYGPLILLVGGLALTAWRHFRATPDAAPPRGTFVIALAISLLAPLIPYIALTHCMHVAWIAIGHVPHPMVDNPKFFVLTNSAFQRSSSIVTYCIAYGGALVYIWFGLAAHLWRRIRPRQSLVLCGVFLASWLAFVCEPRQLLMWWLD